MQRKVRVLVERGEAKTGLLKNLAGIQPELKGGGESK
jgi:hypothetical protein